VSADAVDIVSHTEDEAPVVMPTAVSSAAVAAPDSYVAICSDVPTETTSSGKSASATEMTISTSAPSTVTRRSTTLRPSQSVVEEPTHANEQWQCSECKKSFRSQTLLDYHKKYYHHVAATSRGSRRISAPSLHTSSSVERVPSVRVRSNKSTCMH